MFNEEIRKARLTAGLTQEQLGFAAHISREYVNQLEAGKSSPSLDVFIRLCRAMNVRAADMVRTVETADGKMQPVKLASPKRKTRDTQSEGSPATPPLHRLLGQLLYRWRRETKRTRREIAAKLRVRREDVLMAETGERPVTLIEFLDWCDVCGKSGSVAVKELTQALGHPKSW